MTRKYERRVGAWALFNPASDVSVKIEEAIQPGDAPAIQSAAPKKAAAKKVAPEKSIAKKVSKASASAAPGTNSSPPTVA